MDDSWSTQIYKLWMFRQCCEISSKLDDICLFFSYSVELKTGWWNHPNLDDSVSHLKVGVLYNPNLDNSEHACKSRLRVDVLYHQNLDGSERGCKSFKSGIIKCKCYPKVDVICFWMVMYLPKLDVMDNSIFVNVVTAFVVVLNIWYFNLIIWLYHCP